MPLTDGPGEPETAVLVFEYDTKRAVSAVTSRDAFTEPVERGCPYAELRQAVDDGETHPPVS